MSKRELPTVVLHNKRKPIICFKIDKTEIVQIVKIIEKNKEFLPLALHGGNLTLENLQTWFNKRLIPKDRENRGYVLENHQYFLKTYRNFFSLSDQYWIKVNTNDRWSKLNFFDNDYCEEVGKAFFGDWEVNLDKAKEAYSLEGDPENWDTSSIVSFSPDLTTNGILIKKWKKEGDASYLYKGSGINIDQEPLSEVLASMVLKQLNLLDYVEYNLVIESLQICSKCKNFITRDTEFVPAIHIMKLFERKENEDLMHFFIRCCNEYGIDGAEDYIKKMVYCDYVIGNNDRHLGNFGFIRDANTAKIIGFAPLFDSGSAFQTKSTQKIDAQIIYFSEENKKEAIKYVEKKYKNKLPKKLVCSTMERIINTYPTLDSVQREQLVKLIHNANARVKKISEKEISPPTK